MVNWLGLQLRRCALWWAAQLIAWATPPPIEDPIITAVRDACVACGLSREQFKLSFDLSRTGKIYEVIHYTGLTLGIDHELRTVGDVIAFYKLS